MITMKCDECGKDISSTKVGDDRRITVSFEPMILEDEFSSGTELNSVLHFCGIACLKSFFCEIK